MKNIYTTLLLTEQTRKYFTNFLSFIWIGLIILFCEPPIIATDICKYTISKILMAMMLIGWWISAYTFCGHPTLTSLFFLAGSFASLVNLLSIKPRVRASIPSGLASIGYGNLLLVDLGNLSDLLHLSHFSAHTILLIVTIYGVVSLDPSLHIIRCNHRRVCLAEAIAHGLMGVFEPVYWLLVIQNLMEYSIHKDNED